MLKSISSKYFLILAGILLLSLLGLCWWLNILMQNSQIERSKAVVAGFVQTHARRSLNPQSFVFANDQVSNQIFQPFYEEFKTPDMVRIKVWNTESRVIFSDYKPIIGKVFLVDQELQSALAGNVVVWKGKPSYEENIGELQFKELLSVYTPVYFEGDSRPAGVIETYFDLKEVNILLANNMVLIFVGVFSATAIIFLLAWILFRYLIRKRLAVLVQAAHEIAGGNLEIQVEMKGNDEINELSVAFNYMTSKLKDMYEGLELKVRNRTQELEKDNKIMVGREMKMIELKKEIETLKQQINKDNNQSNND
jgi:methyl-accepting chemotaxis protein